MILGFSPVTSIITPIFRSILLLLLCLLYCFAQIFFFHMGRYLLCTIPTFLQSTQVKILIRSPDCTTLEWIEKHPKFRKRKKSRSITGNLSGTLHKAYIYCHIQNKNQCADPGSIPDCESRIHHPDFSIQDRGSRKHLRQYQYLLFLYKNNTFSCGPEPFSAFAEKADSIYSSYSKVV
jgi:hypothetical protein